MVESSSVIEVIDYKSFPNPLKNGAVGMVYGRVSNCLTQNFFSELIYPFQLDKEGFPSVSIRAC